MIKYGNLCKCGAVAIEKIPFHICKELALLYVTEGELKFHTVSGVHTLHVGDIEILNVLEPMQFLTDNKPSRVLYFCFDKAYLAKSHYSFENVTYNCNVSNFFCGRADSEQIQKLQRFFFRTVASMIEGESCIVVEEHVKKLLTLIREKFDDVSHAFDVDPKQDVSKERFLRLSEYMIDHVSDKLSLEELTKVCYVSKPYLSREFVNKLGKGYTDVTNYYRIINAVIQLLETNDTLTQIAENSGFSSINYYNKVFSSFMGCSPATFRNQYRNAVEKVFPEQATQQMVEHAQNQINQREQVTERLFSIGADEEDTTIMIHLKDQIIKIPLQANESAEFIVRVKRLPN